MVVRVRGARLMVCLGYTRESCIAALGLRAVRWHKVLTALLGVVTGDVTLTATGSMGMQSILLLTLMAPKPRGRSAPWWRAPTSSRLRGTQAR